MSQDSDLPLPAWYKVKKRRAEEVGEETDSMSRVPRIVPVVRHHHVR